jgi:hemerythrin
MARIAWTDQMSVGVPEVDRQHVHLVELLNGLEEGLARGSASRILRGVFAELSSYTKYHFTAEVNVLRADGFHGLQGHLDAHDEFVRKLADLEPLLQHEGADTAALEASRFLRQWIVRHILVADRLAFSSHRPKAPAHEASQQVREVPATAPPHVPGAK